jgi:acetyl/propionyl-CoA carboxylase alpha subunit/acetyl-CoA carboxylase alpha subunit
MDSHLGEGDRLFLIAESLSQDFSLFPASGATGIQQHVRGLLSDGQIARQLELLRNLDIDSYIESVVAPAEDPGRPDAPSAIRALGGRALEEVQDGPYYSCKLLMDFDGDPRTIAFIAQDRSVKNGVWGPEHHLAAAELVGECSKRNIAIVTFMDTPGADAGEDANKRNQAHCISRLIAEMCNVDVPNIGVIYGLGYSGGAIPLAASNLLLAVRDGVFSTIQPKGLASIARRLNLSWQECAKYVGLSPYELYSQGNIDGIVDYAPSDPPQQIDNLRRAIVTGIQSVEASTKQFVAENPYILDHYRNNLERYLRPSRRLQQMESRAFLRLSKTPTEYMNVFGVAYRYLRYLGTRKRIKASTVQQYGRLAVQELPKGELSVRTDRERRQTFLKWLQDPEKIIYDDALAKAWKNYTEKKQALDNERGRIAQLIFGEPRKNFMAARAELLTTVSTYLYNRWKIDAEGNLRSLISFLTSHEDMQRLLRVRDISDPQGLATALAADRALAPVFRARFTHEGRKLLTPSGLKEKSDSYLRSQLATELNLTLTDRPITDVVAGAQLSEKARALAAARRSSIAINRQIVDDRYAAYITPMIIAAKPAPADVTVVDVLLDEDLRTDFVAECENLLLFDAIYDQIIEHLDTVAEEAESTRALSKRTLKGLMDEAIAKAAVDTRDGAAAGEPHDGERMSQQFYTWYQRVSSLPRAAEFIRAVEEWKKSSFPHLSDTLFVVVTFLFDRLLGLYLASEQDRRRYDGRISPRAIGRRKDFWNRLTIAYRDLRIQQVTDAFKARKGTSYGDFVQKFFRDFEELNPELLSSDPCEFPGFRVSIEAALKKKTPPCGVVTGIGTFADSAGGIRVAAAISNVDFQAGAFDMASAEKFCKLLVEAAERQLPVICFISSGGMQTKEGAGALFSMAAVNDRITRFVRDSELPVIVFGFGDCTGGAQASFVTHPLVQTYYFSGTNMPFAGQIVVPLNLPSTATLSNYLSLVPGAMQGLVKHPFFDDLDDALRRIDPEIPLPAETVLEVVHRVMAGSLTQDRPLVGARRPRFRDRDLVRPVERVLIHGRGCTAVKLVRVAQRLGIEVVLVQSDPDMDSIAVDMLSERDRVVCIGGNTPDESYLNAMSVLRVAEHERVDSLHPGIGFLSENSQFAELVRNHGVNFIGPPVSAMDTMGNKSNAINTAVRLNVPVVPGSHGILTNVESAAEAAEVIGYPVLIKAVHGGGGKGIQVVESPDDLHELFHRVTVEARSAFGNGDVYLEKYVTSLRHIEAQLLRDTHGNTRVLGIRDCSVQRDKQKVFEESDSTMLPADLRQAVLQYTAAIGDEIGYVGAGTVEFIFDLKANAVYFMEMNTRLQVEHPVTELVSGVDIVGEQFRIAAGESIAHVEAARHGYAIEARINAERIVRGADGRLRFTPDPGQIVECVLPQEDGIEIIAMAAPGKFVSPYYDSMVAQIIAHGTTRSDTIDKLLDYLSRVRITGISTNIALLKRVLADSVFRDGAYDTNFLPQFLARIDADTLIREIAAAAGKTGAGIDRNAIRIEGSEELKVLSPSTGIFYSTPTPTEPDYVAVGDRIDIDQVICQLEAMKIFTPLALKDFNGAEGELYPSNQRYEVTRINNTSGQQVNVGDLLFVVKPV